jgi:hypothetical protein
MAMKFTPIAAFVHHGSRALTWWMDSRCHARPLTRMSAPYRSCIAVIIGFGWLASSPGPGVAQDRPPSLSEDFERSLAAEVHLTAAERKALLAGGPVTRLLPSDQTREVAVFGAIWIDASAADYVRRVTNIEDFEKGGGFRITRKISNPPTLDDFAQLELPAQDLKDLRRCKPGNCEFKLSTTGLEAFRTQVRWGTQAEKTDADAAFRRLALEYVNGYREGGNARLAVYQDGADPVVVADELRSMIERAPSLLAMLDLRQYLLDYPSTRLTGATDFLYWQEARFGLKPTIRISHLVIQDRPGKTVIASKMLYASHYFWTALEQRVLLADPARGRGFWLVITNRGRSDGLKGFIGRLVRGRVRSEAQKGTDAVLRTTKAKLEAP